MLDEEKCEQFIKYVKSTISGKKEILALEGTARLMSELFYDFYKEPIPSIYQSEEELTRINAQYEEIYQPVKEVLNNYRNARESQDEIRRQKKEAIRILEGIIKDIEVSLEKINRAIGLKKEDKQINYAKEANKKARKANKIAFVALIAAIIIPLIFFIVDWFCGN